MVMYIAAVTIYSHSAGRSVGPLYAETPVLGFRNFHSLPCMSPASSVYACVFSHVQLFVTINCSPPGSSERGIFQARILEWVVISFSRGSSPPRIEPVSLLSPTLTNRFFTTEPPGKPEPQLVALIVLYSFKDCLQMTLRPSF